MAEPVLACPTMENPKRSSAPAQENLLQFMNIATCTDFGKKSFKIARPVEQYYICIKEE